MAAWQAQEAGVAQLCNLLSEFQKPNANQAQVRRHLLVVVCALRVADGCLVPELASLYQTFQSMAQPLTSHDRGNQGSTPAAGSAPA
jgi:hypothetical protein